MISVVMTAYNGSKYIQEQFNSILRQTVLPDEIIVIDDMSEDNTYELLQECKAHAPETIVIKIIENEENLGYIKNFYKAIRMSSGDIIFLCDQDDIWVSNKIEVMVSQMSRRQADVVCTNFDLINGDGEILYDRQNYNINSFIEKKHAAYDYVSLHRLIYGNVAQGCTYCFSKRIRDVYLDLACDYLIHDTQIIFIGACMGKVLYLNDRLIKYRIHENNSVGISKTTSKTSIKRKKIKKTPTMVQFIEDLDKRIPVPHKAYYETLFYLRIPYFRFLIQKTARKYGRSRRHR